MVGKFNPTKKQLIAAIKTAVPEAWVSGNWRDNIIEMIRNLPFVYVRIFPARFTDVYERNIGGGTSGSLANYHFILHIFHSNCYESGEEKGKYSQDLTDRIIDYLIVQPSPVGADIGNMDCRESEPTHGNHKISRVIVEGDILIKRID
jgi:hypothetical protein